MTFKPLAGCEEHGWLFEDDSECPVCFGINKERQHWVNRINRIQTWHKAKYDTWTEGYLNGQQDVLDLLENPETPVIDFLQNSLSQETLDTIRKATFEAIRKQLEIDNNGR